MKRPDNIMDVISEFDFDSFADEMDILFGDRFGAANLVGGSLNNVLPDYSETLSMPQMVENEDEIREANDRLRPIADRRVNGKTLH